MWLAYLLLGLVSAVANEEPQTNSKVTIEDTMLVRRCVPTAVTRGPCHVCACSSRGAYQCHSDACVYEDKENIKPNLPECEPDMLYNDGALWCLCDGKGFWRSSNCRFNFRSVRHKSVTRLGPSLHKDVPCEKGSYYAVDCNVCVCHSSNLTVDACTNRTCAVGGKADACKLGQLVRAGHQLCGCSQIGYYVDDLCINLPTKDSIQKITPEDIAKLNFENPVPANMTCEPHSVIQQDCNSCRCTSSGHLACTSKLCLSDAPTMNNVLRWNRKDLPELKSDTEPCEPGVQYRYKCNTCTCSNNRVPSCTSMICLDFYDAHTEKEEEEEKEEKEEGLRVSEQKVDNDTELPAILVSDNCTHGVTYKMDCNKCLCDHGRLICYKRLCLTQKEVTEQKDFEKLKNTDKKTIDKMKTEKKPIKTLYSTKNKNMYLEVFDDKLVMHQRKGKKKHVVSSPSKSSVPTIARVDEKKPFESEKYKNVEFLSAKVSANNKKHKKASKKSDNNEQAGQGNTRYPALPQKKKCEPGQFYSKGCQRCFCTNKKVARCTNRRCEEMTGPVRHLEDVFPRITPKEIKALSTLPHEAARCTAGKVYMVRCNVCLCVFNGNLFCQSKLCLAVGEINRIAAQKLTGKKCHIKDGVIVPEVHKDCVDCSCENDKFKCEPEKDCTPFKLRRQLHGELHPKVAPQNSIDKGDDCIPGMVYKEKCNNCYCQEDRSLRCTRKGCLTYEQVQKLQKHRNHLLNSGD